MRINLRHGAAAAILAAVFTMLGPIAAHAAAIPGTPADNRSAAVGSATERTAPLHGIQVVQRDRVTQAQPDQMILPAADHCQQWDWFKYDSCRNDGNKCTFRADYVYYRDGRYNEEGYYHCIERPKATLYHESSNGG